MNASLSIMNDVHVNEACEAVVIVMKLEHVNYC
jgi:hypothetical protein